MDKNRLFAGEAYKIKDGKIKVGQIIQDQGKKYLVFDIENNKSNGMQAMAVAEIQEKYKTDTMFELKRNPGYPASVIKKDVTFAYAGSQEWNDWKENFNIPVHRINLNWTFSNQAPSALQFATRVENKLTKLNEEYELNRKFRFTTTGHSLGGKHSGYVATKKNYDGVSFAAPDYGLSSEEVKAYKGHFVNIYSLDDLVVSKTIAGGKDALPYESIGIRTIGDLDTWKWLTTVFGHDLDLFALDKNGNYVDINNDMHLCMDGNGNVALEQTKLAQKRLNNKKQISELKSPLNLTLNKKHKIKKLENENKWLLKQIKKFNKLNKLRNVLGESDDRLTENEEVFLEAMTALTIIEIASSEFDVGTKDALTTYNKGIEKLSDDWDDGTERAIHMAPHLDHSEVMDALYKGGATKKWLVDDDTDKFESKVEKIEDIQDDYKKTIKQIKAGIKTLVKTDENLAQQIAGVSI